MRTDIMVAAVAVTSWFVILHRSTRRTGMWSPLWIAFSSTFFSAGIIVAGVIGYRMSKNERFLTGSAWSDAVIWWQVGFGLALALLAVLAWRKAAAQAA